MKTRSLKELLLRKTGNSELKNLISGMSEIQFSGFVIESLEKMAFHRKGNSKAKSSTNQLVHNFLEMHDPHDVELLRDAIGHHAARFGEAYHAGHSDAANKHARQWVKLNDLARKVEAVSPGALGWDMPIDIKPWQANLAEKWHDKSQNRIDLPGLQYHSNKAAHKHDYSHLMQAPAPHKAGPDRGKGFADDILATKHEGPDGEERHHNGAYPFEHVKVGGKNVSIHDQDTEMPSVYKPHIFDSHPIVEMFNKPVKDIDDKHVSEYMNKLSSYEQSKLDPKVQEHIASKAMEGHGAFPHHDAVGGLNQPRIDMDEVRKLASGTPTNLPRQAPSPAQAPAAAPAKAESEVDWSQIPGNLVNKLKG